MAIVNALVGKYALKYAHKKYGELTTSLIVNIGMAFSLVIVVIGGSIMIIPIVMNEFKIEKVDAVIVEITEVHTESGMFMFYNITYEYTFKNKVYRATPSWSSFTEPELHSTEKIYIHPKKPDEVSNPPDVLIFVLFITLLIGMYLISPLIMTQYIKNIILIKRAMVQQQDIQVTSP